MLRVALTGGIATGKSHCLRRFAALGAPVIDSDELARRALARGSPGWAEVRARFGDAILRPDGEIDRPALAAVIFADDTARRALEAIVHPRVYEDIRAWFAGLPEAPPGYAVADIPLLYETSRAGAFDRVVVAACPPEVQLARLMARNGLPEADARRRLAAQWPIEEKMRRADFVIRTDGTFADTDRQVEAVARALEAEARRR
ncbi:MAG TPA: dephospho-CoA kinase [Vicinamibacterales bacterium]|nr:dephospho-CoA kinase [Vicinamibacterales bacterium]